MKGLLTQPSIYGQYYEKFPQMVTHNALCTKFAISIKFRCIKRKDGITE